MRIGSPHFRSKYTRVILHIPFLRLRYVCVCVSCLIENSILVVLSINPLFLFKPSTTGCVFHKSCHLCLLLAFQNLKPFEVTETPKHLQRPKKRISSDTDTHLLAYGFLTTNANLICRGGILVSGKSLGVFLLGSGAEGCFRGGETDRKMCQLSSNVCVVFFPVMLSSILFKGVCFCLFS